MPAVVFCKIEGIEGDSRVEGFEKQFQLISFELSSTEAIQLSASAHGSLRVPTAAKGEFHIVKTTDNTSPKLMLQLSSGKHIGKIEVILCRASTERPVPYRKYEFDDVVVSSYQPAGDVNDDNLPDERVGFTYRKMKIDTGSEDAPDPFSTFRIKRHED
jgi:type VI secretion system secreted protein Hcp